MKLIIIILTFNEEIHLKRCIESLQSLKAEILVVDSFSTDRTIEIARNSGAQILQHVFLNHANQFNWALEQLNSNFDWVLRIDADEVLTTELCDEINNRLSLLSSDVNGVFIRRTTIFQGKLIKYGATRVKILRLFRFGSGKFENRWMDEHLKVAGKIIQFNGELIDNNLNSLTWWINKHNKYASLEAVELLNLKYKFMTPDREDQTSLGHQVRLKRWLKECIYFNLPSGLRALIYFLYRYVIRFGVFEGNNGMSFHLLHGFWYRYLVDLKVAEVKRYKSVKEVDIKTAIYDVLGITV
jgi:glycosyltransferase involved in cell wall biosynthesis